MDGAMSTDLFYVWYNMRVQEMEARFKRVERQVHWLEHKLQESGYTFQHDYPSRFNEEHVAYESTVPDFEETIDALDDAREEFLGLPVSKFEDDSQETDGFWRVDERAHGFRDRPQALTAGRFVRGEESPSSSHAKHRTAEFRGYDFPSRFGEPVDDSRSRDARGHHQQPRSFLPRFKEPPSDATAPLQRDFGFRSGFGKPAGETRAKSRVEPQQQQQRRDRDFRWIGEPRMPLREPSFPRLGGFRL